MMQTVLVVSTNEAMLATVPAGFTVVACPGADRVRAALERCPRALIVIDADGAGDELTRWLCGRADRGTVVAVARGEVAGADAVVTPGAELREEIGRWLRHFSGAPTRRSPRVACRGRARLDLGPPRPLELEIVELSDDAVRLRPAPPVPVAMAMVELFVDGIRGLRCRVRELRRAGDAVVVGLLDPQPADRAELRAMVARARGVRIAPAPAAVGPTRMIGQSPALRRALETLHRVAPTDVTVLILGETGTGKELAARLIHDGSPRARAPFVAINCAALPENLVESELFGHEPGAFTGAVRRRIGRIEQGHGGTLFLDEIGDLPGGAQAKLLRALQERVIERLGGGEPIRIDVRLIAATNRDLAADIASKTFRADLFYRLSVVTARLPALRERPADIRLLAEHFLHVAMRRLGRHGIRLSEHALARLEAHPWPGNVRELENLATRVVALASSSSLIGPEHLDLAVEPGLPSCPLPATELRDILDYCEREIIRRMLERHGGNRTHTAAALNISRQALQQKLARHRGRADGELAEAG